MSALKYIRSYYGVEAHRGRRIRYGFSKLEGTILGGKQGRLRVRFDGAKRTALLHPTWRVEYLTEFAKYLWNPEASSWKTSGRQDE